MAAALLRASQADRRLELSTQDLLRLVYDRQIRFVMVDRIAPLLGDAPDEHRARAS